MRIAIGLQMREPGRFDVIVGSNLFGDLLTDLSAALMGSIGIAPSANIDPSGVNPSLFEPVHHGVAAKFDYDGLADEALDIRQGLGQNLGDVEGFCAIE